MTPVEQLASDVLAMLATQKRYFDTRDGSVLRESKSMEAKMRKRCNDILHPANSQPELFKEQA